MKKFLKAIGIVFGLIILAAGIFYITTHESEPEGSRPDEAKVMAESIMRAVNAEAWQELRFVHWTFAGVNSYLWDKHSNSVRVRWGAKEVQLDLGSKKGQVRVDGEEIEGMRKKELEEKAWSMFCNDSFWLNAPAKIMDEGTKHSLVRMDDGREGLKVSYTKGGVTPGDSYVWFVDESGLPNAYKMWTSIIPVGGMELSWEDYIELPGGAKISTKHVGSAFTLEITDVAGGMTLEEMSVYL